MIRDPRGGELEPHLALGEVGAPIEPRALVGQAQPAGDVEPGARVITDGWATCSSSAARVKCRWRLTDSK